LRFTFTPTHGHEGRLELLQDAHAVPDWCELNFLRLLRNSIENLDCPLERSKIRANPRRSGMREAI